MDVAEIHWWCPACGTFDGPHHEGFCDVCADGTCIDGLVPRAEVERLREALAKADGEVTALADALRAAGVRPAAVQAIIDNARPRASDITALPTSRMCVKCGGDVIRRPNALCPACLADITSPSDE